MSASRTLMATGGAGQVFRETTNPAIATGDGIAMAFEAGARVTDLEFIQFHPTALNVAGAPRFLLSEALRGEGARLVNQAGEGFVQRYEPPGSRVPRSRRAGDRPRGEANRSAGIPDDGASRCRLRPEPFPDDYAGVPARGIRPGDRPDPGEPGRTLRDGRVDTDLCGRTSIDNLFAAGEAACTGVHGANRLASNSLLEGLVFGARAADAMKGAVRAVSLRRLTTVQPAGWRHDRPSASDVRDVMWRDAGL